MASSPWTILTPDTAPLPPEADDPEQKMLGPDVVVVAVLVGLLASKGQNLLGVGTNEDIMARWFIRRKYLCGNGKESGASRLGAIRVTICRSFAIGETGRCGQFGTVAEGAVAFWWAPSFVPGFAQDGEEQEEWEECGRCGCEFRGFLLMERNRVCSARSGIGTASFQAMPVLRFWPRRIQIRWRQFISLFGALLLVRA